MAQQFAIKEKQTAFYEDLKAGAESGWDFSSRWLIGPDGGQGKLADISTKDIIPVDLNAFIQRNARLLSEFNIIVGNAQVSKHRYHY